jgi:hypothetical protein
MLLKTLLIENLTKNKMEFFHRHEAMAAEEDYYSNQEENPKKAKAAVALQRNLEASAEKTFGKEFADDMVSHTNARLDALYTGRPEREGADAAKIREKHGIDHETYSEKVEVPVHPKLLQRKDVVDPKLAKNMRKIIPKLQEMARLVDTLTSKRSLANQIAPARKDAKKLRDELITALNSLPLE